MQLSVAYAGTTRFSEGGIRNWNRTLRLRVLVGPARFELATFRPPDERANRAAPWPDTSGDYIPVGGECKRIENSCGQWLMTGFAQSINGICQFVADPSKRLLVAVADIS